MTDKLDRNEVKNYPSKLPNTYIQARPRNDKLHYYVMQYKTVQGEDGKNRMKPVIIGKVVEMQYYSMEEYKRLFKRDGTRRPDETTQRAERKRTYTRRTPLRELNTRRQQGLPDINSIKNFPIDNPRARIVRVQDVLYVVASTYLTIDGRHKEQRQYLGRIIDGAFVSSEEYRTKYGRKGSKRQNTQR